MKLYYLILTKKINSKWIKDSSKTRNHKTPRRILEVSSLTSVLAMIFLDLTPKVKTIKAKINKWNYIKLKSFCAAKETIHTMKRQCTEWINCLQIIYLIRDYYPTYIKNSYSPKPNGTWKDAQLHWSSGKCKSKPQWDITSHLSEWLTSKSLQMLARKWRKGNTCTLLVGK